MKAESFTYWLRGFVELTDGSLPTGSQWAMIKEHLDLVFNKQTGGSPGAVPVNPSVVPNDYYPVSPDPFKWNTPGGITPQFIC
jgi:hypothetical protein